jgi:phosphoribosylformimino-5-aminoimidazole carboxamide ribotide isomerase
VKVIGVIDLMAGRAVHARSGMRDRYAPVVKTSGSAMPPGDSLALARAYVEEMGVHELYVADLDAIMGRPPQTALVAQIATPRAPLWLDAAIATVAQAHEALAIGASRIVVGLETLPSFDELEAICQSAGRERVAFSLDVRHGVPILLPGGTITAGSVETIAQRASDSGAGTIVALDLARVGTGTGPDVALMTRLRGAVPDVTLMAGGGVRDAVDLERLAAAGCDGALVASALLSGALTLPRTPS